jgi:putative ATPase
MKNKRPLADRMRPVSFDNFVGQEGVAGEGTMLRRLVEGGLSGSLIFWGPPGVGKTTLARIIARATGSEFVEMSAVSAGKKLLMDTVTDAKKRLDEVGDKTLVFIDEIHRWNKAQQDALLPFVEKGIINLIGATTENPSFELNRALLSRSRVIILEGLSSQNITKVINRALIDKENGFGDKKIDISDNTIEFLAELSGGDARSALNTLELSVLSKGGGDISIKKEDIKQAFQKSHLVFDKNGEEFYNAISALHKSMRGGDANASLYWLARMLEGGVDPLYIARRVVRFASEDIGMANGEAMVQAVTAYQACHMIGMPECSVNIAQAVVYCAKSKKSNSIYTAYGKASLDAKDTSHLGVPLHLRNAPTKFMKDIGYGAGYKYNPDFDGVVDQTYFPDELGERGYF